MATIGDALYDVFGPGRADGGMDMRAYDPAFGEEERVAIQAQLPQLTGRVPIATGPTGVYGRLLADAGRRQAAQAAALGELVTAARGQRMRARDEALIQKQREERAANEATRLQQARLRKNILAGVGEFGENVMSYLQSPAFQSQLKARREAKEAAKSFNDSMSRQKAVGDKALQSAEYMLSEEGFGAAPARKMFGGPTYALGGGSSQDMMLSNINSNFLSDIYGGR